jgi:predicted dienelactone hydrolase
MVLKGKVTVMNRIILLGIIGMVLPLLFACSTDTTLSPEATATKEQTTATAIPEAVVSTEAPPTMTIVSKKILTPASFLLSEPGPYFAGNRLMKIIDESREGREIELLIWYPALEEADADGRSIVRDAAPDMSGAPYPLVLTERDSGSTIFGPHLATHGFVMVSVRSPHTGSDELWSEFVWIDLVRDFLYALDHIASDPPEELRGVIDSDHVGVVGYSYGGDLSLALSGARVNPDFYLSQCEQISVNVPAELQWIYSDFICPDAVNWDAFVTYVGDEVTNSDHGLWKPITDERIRAVMPMAPSVSWYFGESGLAAVDRPILLVWGTRDVLSPYELEAGYTFENLKYPDRYLISFIGNAHGLPFLEEPAARLKHFAAAFFGTYLQGRVEYLEYFSEDFVNQFDDLAWGVYSDE